MFSSHSTHRCDARVNAGMTLHTFDLLFIPEPAQVSGGLAALGDAGQSDVVSLHGGLCQAIDLWLLWHTWRMENGDHSDGRTNSCAAGCHYTTIILVCLIGNHPPPNFPTCREIREQTTEIHQAATCSTVHHRRFVLAHGWVDFFFLTTGSFPASLLGQTKL